MYSLNWCICFLLVLQLALVKGYQVEYLQQINIEILQQNL